MGWRPGRVEMAVTTEQFTRLEDRVDDFAAKTNRLEGAYSQLATKSDIAELRGEMKGIKIGLWVVGVVLILPELLQRFGI